ncbi:MAG: sulfite exporter TauE/SafE family protein [Acidimicrobiia bacterium]
MSAPELAVLLGAVLVAATTQVTVGFGFALLAVPLMAIAVDTHEAVVISTLLGLMTSGLQTWHGRGDIDRPVVRRLVAGAVVGLPVGILVFQRVDERLLKILLGGSVLLAVALLAAGLAGRGSNRTDIWCGVVSGALAASLSTNGPPLVFALQARGLPMSSFRPSINAVFTISGVLSLLAFTVGGDVTSDALVHAAMAVPVMLIGSRVGFLLRERVPESGARRLVLTLLAAAGSSAIVAALV